MPEKFYSAAYARAVSWLHKTGDCLRLFIFVLVMHLAPVSVLPQALYLEGDGYCFKECSWTLGGVAIADSCNRVDSLLGKASRVEKVHEEDDGGDYVNEKRHYEDFHVDIVRGRVDRMFTKSSNVIMPARIKVGLSLHSILAKLNIRSKVKPNKNGIIEFSSCYLRTDKDGVKFTNDAWLWLSFDSTNILRSIELHVNRP